jgi:hypothetical protein
MDRERIENPLVHRKRLWELDCLAKDTILSLAFEWQELLRLCQHWYETPEQMQSNDSLPDYQALSVTHALCHCPTGLAQELERVLNDRYEETIEQVQAQELWQLEPYIRTAELTELTPLAGWVWAMLTDSRDELRKAQQILLHRVKLAGLRALAFGKVELVKVG